jgi:argininosuccinate lyase
MKLWDKGLPTESLIEQFTVGEDRRWDLLLAPWDLAGSLAHTAMLAEVGLLGRAEAEALRRELLAIARELAEGRFAIGPEVEDVHSQVELMLTQRLGEAGKKVHSGRSRNDQVLTDLRLYYMHEIGEVYALAEGLFLTLQAQSERLREVLMPGYTHFQVAMPSSFGLWLGAYAESLADDLLLLGAAWQACDQNPLGSAAGYGSSFPLDREMTARLLGFRTLSYNAIYAQMGRGRSEKALAAALAGIAGTLNKLAADLTFFMCQNLGFLSLPDSLTTGSSIMPHKKNPDVFELIRGHSNRIQALPGTVQLLCANLPSGYHRDFQLLKEAVFPAIAALKDCLRLADFALERIEAREAILDDPRYEYVFSVEEVNRRVLGGQPFRDAYREVGLDIQEGRFQPERNVHHTHLGSIGNLASAQIRQKWEENSRAFRFEAFRAAIRALSEGLLPLS